MSSLAVTQREELHELVNALPESELKTAVRYLRYLRAIGTDPVLRALLEAPIDDEPETPEEATAVAEAREAIARGDLLSDEQLRRELGL